MKFYSSNLYYSYSKGKFPWNTLKHGVVFRNSGGSGNSRGIRVYYVWLGWFRQAFIYLRVSTGIVFMKIVEGRTYWAYGRRLDLSFICRNRQKCYSSYEFRKEFNCCGIDDDVITSELAQALYGDL